MNAKQTPIQGPESNLCPQTVVTETGMRPPRQLQVRQALPERTCAASSEHASKEGGKMLSVPSFSFYLPHNQTTLCNVFEVSGEVLAVEPLNILKTGISCVGKNCEIKA